METEKIGFFRRLGIAMARPKDYDKLANQTVGNTIFTFLIITLVQVAVIVGLIVWIFSAIIPMIDGYIEKLPDFTVSKDGISTESKQPMVYESEGNIMLFIFDENYSLKDIPTAYADKLFSVADYVVVGKDGIQINDSTATTQTQTYLFSNLGENVYDKEGVIALYDSFFKGAIGKTFIASIALTFFIVLFMIKIIGGLAFGVLGLIICDIQGKKISFKKLFNISMYAGTLTALMFILGGFILTAFTFWTGLQLVIITIYIIFAIKHMNSDEQTKIDVKIE